MIEQARQFLQHTYGYSQFRGNQEAVIETAFNGQDSLVLMPTGGGKSICYQIPGVLKDGLGIIISPLIALMQDQVSALQQLGIKAAFLNSSLDEQQQQDVFNKLDNRTLDLLYIAPERILQPYTLNKLSHHKAALIAIDEAHCVSQWGHDFREDYLSLHQLRKHFPDTPHMALTATADQRTRDEIVHRIQLKQPKFFISGFDRPNIHYQVQTKTDAKKQLLRFLASHRDETGIIYCMSRKKVESTADWLSTHGFKTFPYHAGLSNEQRRDHQHRFLNEDGIIIVATIAFGMGIDKPDVRFVAHLDLPKSIEAYYQETGRAGRDGEAAEAWMVYGLQDVVRLRQMTDESNAPQQQKNIERHKLNALLGWCELTRCRRRALLEYFGDTLKDDCGNCDTCLNPPKTWDATEDAQKLLSCVYRTGQIFGAGHVIDVLRGKQTDKILQHRHRLLSVYGLGKHMSDQQWRSIIRQLLVQGLLKSEVERYGALVLTEQSRPLLRGKITLYLRQDLYQDKPAVKKKPKLINSTVSAEDRLLWERLRECRNQLAKQQGVPPYVIFHDATLMEMMEYRPSNINDLLHINGIGETKLKRYGKQFIAIINSS